MAASWGTAPVKVTAPGGTCATCCLSHLSLPSASLSKRQGQISTCPYFCGSRGLVWGAPSTSLSDPIAFLLPSFSLHGNPPCSTASCALRVCNTQVLHTLFDILGFIFCLRFVVFSFLKEIVPFIQTMSLLCCQMNAWVTLFGSKSCTNNQALFSHAVSWGELRNSHWQCSWHNAGVCTAESTYTPRTIRMYAVMHDPFGAIVQYLWGFYASSALNYMSHSAGALLKALCRG